MEKKDVEVPSEGTHRRPLTWHGHEYVHAEKTPDWYWALGLIAVAGAVASLLFNNVLFSILILFGAFVLALFAAREPQEVQFALTQRGVRVDDKLYPYQALTSFAVDERSVNHTPKLLIEFKSHFAPTLIIPLENVDADHVHDYLLDYLPEEEHFEPVSHRVMEWLGF
jgi:hypothetical protein